MFLLTIPQEFRPTAPTPTICGPGCPEMSGNVWKSISGHFRTFPDTNDAGRVLQKVFPGNRAYNPSRTIQNLSGERGGDDSNRQEFFSRYFPEHTAPRGFPDISGHFRTHRPTYGSTGNFRTFPDTRRCHSCQEEDLNFPTHPTNRKTVY